MPRASSGSVAQRCNAQIEADHPYQRRYFQQASTNNNHSLHGQRRDYGGNSNLRTEQHKDDWLDLCDVLNNHYHPLVPEVQEAPTTIVASLAATKQPQEQQTATVAHTQGRTMRGEEASQFSLAWSASHIGVLESPLQHDPASNVPGDGDDSSTNDKSEEGHDNKEEHEDISQWSQQQAGGILEGPYPFDIVCGRGVGTDQRPGNQYFRQIVGLYTTTYVEAPDNRTKKAIIVEIVARMKNFGRFLRNDENTGRWVAVSDDTARSKVGQQLRYQIRAKLSESVQLNDGGVSNLPVPFALSS